MIFNLLYQSQNYLKVLFINNLIWAATNLIWPIWAEPIYQLGPYRWGRAGRPGGRTRPGPDSPLLARARSPHAPGDAQGDGAAVVHATPPRPTPVAPAAAVTFGRRAARRSTVSSPSIRLSSPSRGPHTPLPPARVAARRLRITAPRLLRPSGAPGLLLVPDTASPWLLVHRRTWCCFGVLSGCTRTTAKWSSTPARYDYFPPPLSLYNLSEFMSKGTPE